MQKKKQRRAFTLIELMIVVAIIGILASVAIPAFARYVKRSKTAEALTNLPRIYSGVMAYYQLDHTTRTGMVPSLKLPTTAPARPVSVPLGSKVTLQESEWNDNTWQALQFAITNPILYRYQYCLGGSASSDIPCEIETVTGSAFEVVAQGDLDGDGVPSMFVRSGLWVSGSTTEIAGSGIYVDSELE